MTGMKFRNIGAIAMVLAVCVMASPEADARKGGSMGSRGSRTHMAPASTRTAPGQVAPIQRTMADKPRPSQATAPNARQTPAAPSKFGGMAKGLIGGLIAGGLIAALMGGGLGALGGSGMLMALLQVALIGGIVWFGMRMLRRRPAMAMAGAPAMAPAGAAPPSANPFAREPQPAFTPPSQPQFFAAPQASAPESEELEITNSDKEAFEALLTEVQDAFAREDFARLRACTTPEVMSYLAEELSQNATKGQRNDVSGTLLLEAEVAEAWSEDGSDYATIAMQYQSIDIMRDRVSGAVVEGDAVNPAVTTELWTFVRDASNAWRLSAIQQA